MLIKIGDIYRDLSVKMVSAYLGLPLWVKVILLPIQLIWWVTVFIIGWIMMIPYAIKYGKDWRKMDLQHQNEWTKKYIKEHYDYEI